MFAGPVRGQPFAAVLAVANPLVLLTVSRAGDVASQWALVPGGPSVTARADALRLLRAMRVPGELVLRAGEDPSLPPLELAGADTRTPADEDEWQLDYPRWLDRDLLDRVPLLGPPLSILLENGYAAGQRFVRWLEEQLESLGVRTFADLRIDDDEGADPRPEHRYRLVVMAADVTRGELLRLPWDYGRYGLDPDEQRVADAVRASISVPYLFEPFTLRHPGGESLLVDGGLVSNYPIDAFDRTDGRRPRWPTLGVTLIPRLPAGAGKLLPGAGALRLVPGYGFGESLLVTALVGRDQGYLEQPWVRARSIEVDNLGVNPFEFWLSPPVVDRLYESGRRAAAEFLQRWSFDA